LSKAYEPKAPAPLQRLATLQAAIEAGLNVFVAMAPTFPECDEADLRATMKAVVGLKPITLFHEPINIRAANVSRIQEHAGSIGVKLKTAVFATRETWQDYAVDALLTVERIAVELGISDRLHLWPDSAIGSRAAVKRLSRRFQGEPDVFQRWLQTRWNRVSEWPKSDFCLA
jgi:DNA repair photolyase